MAGKRWLWQLGFAVALLVAAATWWGTRPSPPSLESPSPATKPDGVSRRAAFFEVAVMSERSEAELERWTTPQALRALVPTFARAPELREALGSMLDDPKTTSVEAMSAERYILPLEEHVELLAPTLSAAERARFFASKSVLVLRLRAPGGPPHLVAHAGFGLGGALAAQLGGFVYDDVRERIERAEDFGAHARVEDFVGGALVVRYEPYPEDETKPSAELASRGRLLTLGMARFGAADLELGEVAEDEAGSYARVLTALARKAAERPFERAWKGAVRELAPASAVDTVVTVNFEPAELAEGNPDNELLRVISSDADVRTLRAATATQGVQEEEQGSVEARRSQLAASLPNLLERWKKERGRLYLLVDFVGREQVIEAMWAEVSTCAGGRCKATLANEPTVVTERHLGEPVTFALAEVSGARLELPSGATLLLP